MKIVWKKMMMVVVVLGILPFIARAESASHGPKDKRFGAGIFLGEPTGVTVRGYLFRPFAIDALASWSFVDEAFTFIGDVTYDFFDIPAETSVATFPFYAGAGAKVGFDRRGKNDGKTIVGLRVPVGVASQFTQYPIEVFFEVAPGMEVAPAAEPDIMGGIGVRFYFF